MKRAEFIKLWCESIRAGRQRNFPDIRPSEAAMAWLDDMKSGAKWWRKYRAEWAGLTAEQVRALLTKPAKPRPQGKVISILEVKR